MTDVPAGTASSRFPLGQVVATPAALDAMAKANLVPETLLARHGTGDWGDVCPDDAAANDRALIAGERLFSVYRLSDEITIWVITEHDRTVTTLLTPDDY